RAATLAFSVLVLAATGYLFIRIPKGFIPDSDNDQILIQTEAEQGISFEQMNRYQQMVADIARRDPSVIAFYSGITGSNSNFNASPNFGRLFLHLKPRSQRDSLDVILSRMRRNMSGLPFMRVYLQNPPTIRIGGQVTAAQYHTTFH